MLKRVVCILLICLLLTGCGAETGNTTEKQVVVAMTSDYSMFMLNDYVQTTHGNEYRYDEYGRLSYEKWIVEEETVSTSRYFRSRDGLECTEVSFDHNGWIPYPCSRVKEVFNENGKVKEKTVYAFLFISQRSVYTYDDAGNLIRLEVTDKDGNLTILQEYRYDEAGNQTMTIDVSEPGKECVTEYTYDENGNRLGWYYRENGALQEYVETTYDEQGREVFSARYDPLGNQLHYWIYTYSDDGRIVTTDYSGERTTIDNYNESGLLTRSESRDSEGNLIVVTNYIYETIQVKHP